VESAESCAPSHRDVTVLRYPGKTLKQRSLSHFHYLSNDGGFVVFQNNLTAAKRAILERVIYVKQEDGTFAEPPQPVENIFEDLSEFREQLKKLSYHATPMRAHAFAALYQDRRKIPYYRAACNLVENGFSEKFSHVKAFVKREKLRVKPGKNVEDVVCRVIQPRTYEYVVETGRYIKLIEKNIYENINTVFGYTAIAKGMNAEQRATTLRDHWEQFRDPVCVGLDAKRMDEHVSFDALVYEHGIYEEYYRGDKWFKYLLSLQRKNRGSMYLRDGKIKYRVNRNRMSGDVNTSLGNVVLMCALLERYISQKGIRARVFDDGDDSVTIMERKDLETFTTGLDNWFRTFGFSMEVEDPVYIFERIVFCSCQPVFDGMKWIMVRDPRTAIAKDCLVVKPLNSQKLARRWMNAVGKGGLSLAGGIPVWQNFFRQFSVKGEGVKPLSDPTMENSNYWLARGQSRTFLDIIPANCRYSFWLAFGIPPEAQLAIERTFDEYMLSADTDQPVFRTLPINM